MIWFFAVLIVLALGGIAVVATGGGGGLAPAYDDRPDARVPADRPLTGDDLRELRLTTAVRGYRASEVDALLALLAEQLDATPSAPSAVEEAPEDTAGQTAVAPESTELASSHPTEGTNTAH